MKNFYAIKVGNGVKNLIVTSWDECQKYVLYYNAIFKGFKTRKEAVRYLKNMSDDEIEYRLAWNQVHRIYRLRQNGKASDDDLAMLEELEEKLDEVSGSKSDESGCESEWENSRRNRRWFYGSYWDNT